jgi:integrase
MARQTHDQNRRGTHVELKKATFEKYLDHWRKTYMIVPKLKPSTIQGYASNIARHIQPEFEGCLMSKITTLEVTAFEARLMQKLAKRTVRSIMILLQQIFDNARKEHFIEVSPMIDYDQIPRDKSKKGRCLTPSEITTLMGESSDKLKPLVWIALLAGLQRAEIFALHWDDDKRDPRSFVDFEHDVIRVRQSLYFRHGKYLSRADGEPSYMFQLPKSNTSVRDVPLSPALKRELLNLKLRSADKHGLLFQTATGLPVDPNNVCRWYKRKKDLSAPVYDDGTPVTLPTSNFCRAVAQADIGNVRFHDLRHTYGSMKLNSGALIHDVSRWMGHSSIQVTVDIYGHQDQSDRGQEACMKTDRLLGLGN